MVFEEARRLADAATLVTELEAKIKESSALNFRLRAAEKEIQGSDRYIKKVPNPMYASMLGFEDCSLALVALFISSVVHALRVYMIADDAARKSRSRCSRNQFGGYVELCAVSICKHNPVRCRRR